MPTPRRSMQTTQGGQDVHPSHTTDGRRDQLQQSALLALTPMKPETPTAMERINCLETSSRQIAQTDNMREAIHKPLQATDGEYGLDERVPDPAYHYTDKTSEAAMQNGDVRVHMLGLTLTDASLHVRLDTCGQTAFGVLDSGCAHSIIPE